MAVLKSTFGSIVISVFVLALAFAAGNYAPAVLAIDGSAAEAATQEQAQAPAGEIKGTAIPGDKVVVTQGQALIGEAVAGADGAWRVPIPKVTSPATPYHIRILPSEKRGGVDVAVDGPVSLVVSVTIGASMVEVRVQVTSSNGRIEVDVLAPLDPVTCGDHGDATQAQSTPQATNSAAYHQVKRGETLAVIAARYGVTTQALMEANRLRNANLIYVGQRLLIPPR